MKTKKQKYKTREDKTREYDEKYQHIPINITNRLVEQMNQIGYTSQQIEEIIRRCVAIKKGLRYTEISTVLYEIPCNTPRPRFRGKHVYVPNAKDNHMYMEKHIKELTEDNFKNIAMICTECSITLTGYFPIPASMSKVEKILAELGYIRPIGKPDWDNIGKAYSDMCTLNVFADDSFVISGSVEKFYSFKPRIEIKIRYANNHVSKYNQNIALRKIQSLGLTDYQDINLLEDDFP